MRYFKKYTNNKQSRSKELNRSKRKWRNRN